jgi:hypothetical protein
MDPKSGKPLRLFLNPFTIWTNLALKTGEAMIASAHAVASEATARRVAVIPTADAPALQADAPAARSKAAPASALRKAKAKAKARVKAKARRKPRVRR